MTITSPLQSANPESVLARTALYPLHLELGAKMVAFAGYLMPLHYSSGILKEHLHARSRAALFDVSHMGQIRVTGTKSALALEALVPADVLGLAAYQQRYALFTHSSGGILDDLMITYAGDSFRLVVNAACKQQDLAYLSVELAGHCKVEEISDHALLALQGPAAVVVMARVAPKAADLLFMNATRVNISGAECFITRCGYTGEDGFEISVPNQQVEALARLLLAQDEVAAVGLGARDSLRLEAGLCLYGHDIDITTTPAEAGLGWAISKARREGGVRAGGFPGSEIILRQFAQGTARKRVGILPEGKIPVREGAELLAGDGRHIGKITSGSYGATVGRPIAMGYVETEYAKPGGEVHALVRGKPLPCRVAGLPFVERHYYRG